MSRRLVIQEYEDGKLIMEADFDPLSFSSMSLEPRLHHKWRFRPLPDEEFYLPASQDLTLRAGVTTGVVRRCICSQRIMPAADCVPCTFHG